MKVFATNDFKKGLKSLQSKHENRILEDLYLFVSSLKNDFTQKTKDHNTHSLKKIPFKESHIKSHSSDILLLWVYDVENDVLILKLRDLTNHKELKVSKYQKEVKYKPFDITSIKDTLRYRKR